MFETSNVYNNDNEYRSNYEEVGKRKSNLNMIPYKINIEDMLLRRPYSQCDKDILINNYIIPLREEFDTTFNENDYENTDIEVLRFKYELNLIRLNKIMKEDNNNFYMKYNIFGEYSILTPTSYKGFDLSKSSICNLFRSDNIEYKNIKTHISGTSYDTAKAMLIMSHKSLNGSDKINPLFRSPDGKINDVKTVTYRDNLLASKCLGVALFKYAGLGDSSNKFKTTISLFKKVKINTVYTEDATGGVSMKTIHELYSDSNENKISSFVLDFSNSDGLCKLDYKDFIAKYLRIDRDKNFDRVEFCVGTTKDSIVVLSNDLKDYYDDHCNSTSKKSVHMTHSSYVLTQLEYISYVRDLNFNDIVDEYISGFMDDFKISDDTVDYHNKPELIKFISNIILERFNGSQFNVFKEYLNDKSLENKFLDSSLQVMDTRNVNYKSELPFIKALSVYNNNFIFELAQRIRR